MSDHVPILHHYKPSPFSKKVRLAFGIKGLAWHSVEIAPQPPRPLLTPLTGGYRRVPVLQIGADIFCDTNIILPALERLAEGPSLYGGAGAALGKALSFNFERAVWLAAIGVAVHFKDEDPPAEFLRDRKDDYLYVDMSKAAMEPKFAQNLERVRAQLAWLAETLADDRPFLGGEAPGALDLGYFLVLWLIRGTSRKAEVDAALGLAPILPWYERVAAIGNGRWTEITAEAALTAAHDATPAPVSHVADADDRPGPKRGMRVKVTPDDFARVPVTGTLVAADSSEIVIHLADAQTGDLHLHFPRAGFDLEAA